MRVIVRRPARMLPKKLKNVDAHIAELLRGSLVAFFAKVAATLTSFAFHIVLARALGVQQTGVFFLAIALVTISGVISRLGLDNALLRFTSGHAVAQEWPEIQAIYHRALGVVIVSAGITSLVLWLISPWMSEHLFSEPDLAGPMRYMSLAIIPISMISVHSQLLKAIKRVGISVLTQNALLLGLVMVGLLILPHELHTLEMAQLYAVAALITAVITAIIWRRARPGTRRTKNDYSFGELFSSSAYLYVSSIMNSVVMPWAALILLGIWGVASDVGRFGIANRTATLISFALLVINSIAAPKFAELFRQGDAASVRSTAQMATLLMMLFVSPVVVLFLAAPAWVMGLFGANFKAAAPMLVILTLGQVVNVAAGSVGYLLMMSGHERKYRNATLIAGTINLLLGFVLIPMFGALGASVSTAVSVAAVNIISAFYVWRYLGFVAFPWWNMTQARD